MNASSTWWFVGDLHLGPAGHDPRGLDDAFSGFVDRVVLRSLSPDRHLVLLGDTFELRRTRGPQDPGATIRRTGLAFPGVFDGLRRCLAAGVGVHLVCGNHDYPLMSPAGRDAVGRLLGGASAARGSHAQIHPWLLHRAGLFYAEHGNQHHELNRLPQLLLAGTADGAERLPATVLEEWGRHRGPRVPLRGLAATAGALRATAGAEREARGRDYQRLVGELEGHQLPEDTVRALHALSRFSTAGAFASTGRRMAARRRGRPDHDSYLRSAAARIDELVLGTGVHRPLCYVFGHTHVEALTELAGGDAWYANTGTWSRHVRHDVVLHRFPFLVVGRTAGGRPAVRLDYWDSALRKVVCPAVADGGYRRLADTFRP